MNGIILLNKERGVSSNKCANKVKYIVGANKAGHLGTLDVLGEGLLPITLDKGTKLFDYFLKKDKVYIATFKFGQTTETLDLEGKVIKSNDVIVTLDMINQVIPNFIGKINQYPPVFSAKKINGKKAYELSRQGKYVILKPKEIEIYSLICLGQLETNTFKFKIHCSSGTYIRSLCRDIAEKLNTYGVMLSIIRTRCGIFDLKDSFTLSEIKNGNFEIITLDKCFNFEKIYLSNEDKNKLLNGQIVKFNRDGVFSAFSQSNEFLGVVEINNGNLKFKLRLV